jgi:hypothetical protein
MIFSVPTFTMGRGIMVGFIGFVFAIPGFILTFVEKTAELRITLETDFGIGPRKDGRTQENTP